MKICKVNAFLCSVSALALGLSFAACAITTRACAEDIRYDGTEEAAKQLKPDPFDQSKKGLYPGNGVDTSLSGNTVTITNGTNGGPYHAPSAVYGGVSFVKKSVGATTGHDVTNNKVIISGNVDIDNDDKFAYAVYGGFSCAESDNLDGSYIWSIGGTVSGNEVTITNSTVKGNIIGGYSYGFSGYSMGGTVSDNTVVIKDSIIRNSVVGGHSRALGWNIGEAGTVSGNKVFISGQTEINGSVTGGFANPGFNASTARVINNSVTITGGTIGGSVVGGENIDNGANHSIKRDISNNSVTISGETKVDGDVYGGYHWSAAIFDLSVGGKITNNTVTLSGDKLTIGGVVYGGLSVGKEKVDDVFSGNRLNLNGFRGQLKGIKNFEYFSYILPKDIVNGDSLVKITGPNAVNLDKTKHSVAMENDGNVLKSGDRVVLIDKVSGTPTFTDHEVKQGHFIVYDMDMSVEGDDLVLKVKDKTDNTPQPVRINARSKAFSEGRAASMGFVAQGNDLMANEGIDAAYAAVQNGDVSARRPAWVPFLIGSRLSQTLDTGGDVKVRGYNTALGMASGIGMANGNTLVLGAFFEYGNGSYDTDNSFAHYDPVRADGDVDYKGGGVLMRMDFAGTGLNRVQNMAPGLADGLYLKASVSTGRATMDFDSGDLIDAEGYRGSYDSKVTYYSAHTGMGYVFNFDEKKSLDLYGRYLWTRLEDERVKIGKDRLSFDSAQSSRLQIGTRYSYVYNQQLRPWLGAAYEYEFKGEQAAKAYQFELEKPSLKGNTGIFEAGFNFMPYANKKPLSIDVTARGFLGQRQGGAGTIKLKYKF